MNGAIQHIEAVHGSFNGDSLPPTSLEEAGDLNTLNTRQREVFDRVLSHYHAGDDTQLLMHVDGVAGTGKSRVIDLVSKHLAYHSAQKGDACPVRRGAPTGVAAHGIQGSTLHRLLSLPVKKPRFVELNEESLSRLQDNFRSCWLLIIDEKSMIGAQALY